MPKRARVRPDSWSESGGSVASSDWSDSEAEAWSDCSDDRVPLLASDSDSDVSGLDFPDGGDWSDGEVCEDGDPAEPVSTLIDYCIQLLLMRVLNAKQFCIIMWLGGLCGLENMKKLGLPVTSKSGHFARTVRRKLGLYTDVDMYIIRLPGKTKKSVGRVVTECVVYNVHEIFKIEHANWDEDILRD